MPIKKMIKEFQLFGLKSLIYHTYGRITKDYSLWYNINRNKVDSMPSNKLIKDVENFFEYRTGRKLNLENPITFDEKIQWLKIYDSTPLKTLCADKFAVREYVKEKIGEKYLVPLLGVWDSFDDIDFDALPNSFALKTNHASGTNMIVKDKTVFDKCKAKKQFEKWLKCNPQAYRGFELHYRDIPPKIIAKEYIHQLDGDLYDYKIHCFNGRAEFVQIIGERDFETHTAKQAFYDRDWKISEKSMSMKIGDYPSFEKEIPCPKNWNEMLEIAEKFSKDFCYVSVDLYCIEENPEESAILFGELTFCPLSGTHTKWKHPENNTNLGNLLRLPVPSIKSKK